MSEDNPNPRPPMTATQASLSSVRLQHFNYLSPAASQSAQQQQQQQQQNHPQQFQFMVGSGTERRHYSFDADIETQRYPLGNISAADYDQTEGLGGLSVSSYDSIDDDRIDNAMRYPYHGHVSDHGIPYVASSLYSSSSSFPIEDNVAAAAVAVGGYAAVNGDCTPSDISSSISPPNGQIGNNKYSTIPPGEPGERLLRALNIEEQSRLAVEEDKRRRNTAASARFRVKKKQREQALERAVLEATEVKASLEARVTQLEMENRWLKNLLTEKNENLVTRLAALQPSFAEGAAATGAYSSGGDAEKSSEDASALLPIPSSSTTTSLNSENQTKKSDPASPTSQKPTVGVGTNEASKN